MVANLGHLVQPLIIVFLGGIVLFIILAVFLPIIQMITQPGVRRVRSILRGENEALDARARSFSSYPLTAGSSKRVLRV